MNAIDAIDIAARHAAAEADPIIAAVHAYWRGLNGGGVPARKAFDFMAIYREAPNLLLAECQQGATYRFIYCGTTVADNFPLDLTGKSYGPDTPRISKVPWPRLFSSVIDTPCIRFGEHSIDWPGPKFSQILFGAFPLADDAGRARFAMTALAFAGRR